MRRCCVLCGVGKAGRREGHAWVARPQRAGPGNRYRLVQAAGGDQHQGGRCLLGGQRRCGHALGGQEPGRRPARVQQPGGRLTHEQAAPQSGDYEPWLRCERSPFAPPDHLVVQHRHLLCVRRAKLLALGAVPVHGGRVRGCPRAAECVVLHGHEDPNLQPLLARPSIPVVNPSPLLPALAALLQTGAVLQGRGANTLESHPHPHPTQWTNKLVPPPPAAAYWTQHRHSTELAQHPPDRNAQRALERAHAAAAQPHAAAGQLAQRGCKPAPWVPATRGMMDWTPASLWHHGCRRPGG